MEASPAVVTAYEAALPDDPRVESKRMFGMPCAFVNRQMFFGTFDESLIARVGPDRVAALAETPLMRVFVPTAGRPWRDYVQVDLAAPADVVKGLAAEALTWALRLPPKVKRPKEKKAKKARPARAVTADDLD